VLVDVGGVRVLFSGDLGRPNHPLLLPRPDPPAARVVVVESTYGDTAHPAPATEEHDRLGAAIRRTIGRGGSVVIPAFAVDRTELVLLAVQDLRRRGRIPDVPVYVDSPMALAALEVYRRPELGDEMRPEALQELLSMHNVNESRTAEESQRLNNPGRPCIIVSASGMATGGRVLHHLAHLLPHPRNCVVLTGYQAVGTRGRALQDGAREIKLLGTYVRVRAEVVVDDTFSVHADASELASWLQAMPEPPQTVYVVHGEPAARTALAERIRRTIDCAVVLPRLGERVLL
jgi:metallo-beta-lactamase family protein